MIISVCGPLGLETAKKLFEDNREVVEKRFAPFFIEQFNNIYPVTAPREKNSWEILDGGIYRTLWNVGEALNCGMEIFEERIPVRQEIIEILELFDESPYETSSKGSFIVVTEEEIKDATAIGRTTNRKARLLLEKEFERYLTPPKRQERDIQDRKSYC